MFSIPWRGNNAGKRETLTWVEWVRAIGRAAGWDGGVVAMPRDRLPEHLVPDQDMGQHLVVDTTRIREELGYRERISEYLRLCKRYAEPEAARRLKEQAIQHQERREYEEAAQRMEAALEVFNQEIG